MKSYHKTSHQQTEIFLICRLSKTKNETGIYMNNIIRTKVISILLPIVFVLVLNNQIVKSQTSLFPLDPRILKGYNTGLRLWQTDPELRLSVQKNIDITCERGRSNKRMGKPGLSQEYGAGYTFAKLLEKGDYFRAGIVLHAEEIIKKQCPDAQ